MDSAQPNREQTLLTDEQIQNANLEVIEFILKTLKPLNASPSSVLQVSANILGIMLTMQIEPRFRLQVLDICVDNIKSNIQELEKNGG